MNGLHPDDDLPPMDWGVDSDVSSGDTSRRLTVAIVVASLLGTAVLIAAAISFAGGSTTATTPDIGSTAVPSGTAGDPSGSATDAQRASMVAFAKTAIITVLHRSPQTYDGDVGSAVSLMTPTYAQTFRDLAASQKSEIISSGISTDATVSAAGVVAATPKQGQLLLFVDQTSTIAGAAPPSADPTTAAPGSTTSAGGPLGTLSSSGSSPMAVVVSLVRSNNSWQVDDLETTDSSGGPRELNHARRTVLARAARVARAFVNIDYRTAASSFKTLHSLSTGDLLSDYKTARAQFEGSAKTRHAVMTGNVIAAGLVSLGDDSATVLVATDGQVTNAETQGRDLARSFRLRIDFTRVHGHWLAAQLDLV